MMKVLALCLGLVATSLVATSYSLVSTLILGGTQDGSNWGRHTAKSPALSYLSWSNRGIFFINVQHPPFLALVNPGNHIIFCGFLKNARILHYNY